MLNSLIAAALLSASFGPTAPAAGSYPPSPQNLPAAAAEGEVTDCLDDAETWLPGTLQIHSTTGAPHPLETPRPLQRIPASSDCALV